MEYVQKKLEDVKDDPAGLQKMLGKLLGKKDIQGLCRILFLLVQCAFSQQANTPIFLNKHIAELCYG